ncbi:MoxR family ATPase [Nodosilinea sp. LEGE 07298]|uniref:AAA family ATPase n=1 Tax=Nodosilinea sp. LEGE 07298 TaxID=2777970 RepID=UPI00187E1599|nr:MoxR family ATPase [Nodosilinea sp. LEGE 07298]MBE9112492.1 MoxR family ATPase [Nodosilinea sp. LEGE 07298]
MTVVERLKFYGDRPQPESAHKDAPQQPEPYVVTEPLKKAVNLALFLRRPLLLEGDAGCGKTRLAYSVAYELGLPLYRWDVRSSTRAQDGLYEYDAILRLHDVEVQKIAGAERPSVQTEAEAEDPDEPPAQRDPGNPKHYRTFGPLGKAFRMRDRPAVVLIDEIDKADLDFPNDLLTVLDEPWAFTIRETRETITADEQHKPIVIITSNKEKGNLPAPFLRRCLYRYLDFPNQTDTLKKIVQRHYEIQSEAAPTDELQTAAADKFLTERKNLKWFKPPGTSEFLDWLKALHAFEDDPYSTGQLNADTHLPYRELLFKRQDDWRNSAKAS